MLFTAENTASFEAIDSISNTDVSMKKIGNNTLKITCDVMVDWPIIMYIVNPSFDKAPETNVIVFSFHTLSVHFSHLLYVSLVLFTSINKFFCRY